MMGLLVGGLQWKLWRWETGLPWVYICTVCVTCFFLLSGSCGVSGAEIPVSAARNGPFARSQSQTEVDTAKYNVNGDETPNITVVTYNMDDMTRCTRSCTVHGSLGCWEKSLDHYTRQLHRSLNEYIGTLVYIQRWAMYNRDAVSTTTVAKELLESVLKDYPDPKSQKRVGPLTAEELSHIVELLLNETTATMQRYSSKASVLPSFTCPVPDSYTHDLWKMLFLVTVTTCALCALSVVCYMCAVVLRTHRHRSYSMAPRR